MSSWAAEIRRREAERRREEREDRRRRKDLEQRIKERARLSELEQARLEVEMYENVVAELLSVHKDHGTKIDWMKYAATPSPLKPLRTGRNEFSARLAHGVAPLESSLGSSIAVIEEAHLLDERAHEVELEEYAKKLAEWTRMCALAKRVLTGQSQAYSEAIAEFAPFSDVTVLGSSIHVTVHSPKLLGCVLTVNGREIIPAEMKSLTASGKLSVKAMPKMRFHEIYQDYVCGCVLRLAREMFALLPVSGVLVTALVNAAGDRTGNRPGVPVLSVAIDRPGVERLNFEKLDPSDAMESFVHHGDAKASRKSGEFVPIVPLTPEDLVPTQPERMDFSRLLTNVRQLRADIGFRIKPVDHGPGEDASDPPPIA